MTMVSCRNAFTGTLESLAERDDSIFVIVTDSRGSVTADRFIKKFPNRFIEAGIAEQNAVAVAAGLSLTQKTVFVAGPACFLSSRSYEQVKADVAYNMTDVKIIGVSAGVSYGPLGGTHTSLHDFAGFRALPNLEIFAPADDVSTKAVVEYLAKSRLPAYMRIGRGDVPRIYNTDNKTDVRKARIVCEGSDMTVIVCGETVWHAKQAAAALAQEGLSVRVLDMQCLKPADEQAVITAAKETGLVLTVEEHSVYGGLGELVCGIIARNHPVPVEVLGFPDAECKIGKSSELFAYYGLDTAGIIKSAKSLVERNRYR